MKLERKGHFRQMESKCKVPGEGRQRTGKEWKEGQCGPKVGKELPCVPVSVGGGRKQVRVMSKCMAESHCE